MKKILVAGATGYLGKYITEELVNKNYSTKVLVRNPEKFKELKIKVNEIITAEVTDKSSLINCCNSVDVVISTIGITKQKDGLSYMDVDYQANLNLLDEAKTNGVRKFVYVSVFNAEKIKNLKGVQAKVKFEKELKDSGLDYSIIYPNGFFSDMTEFFRMAQGGRVYLFG